MSGPVIKIGNQVARFTHKSDKPKPPSKKAKGYSDMKRTELIDLAKSLGIKIKSGIKKSAVIKLLRGER